MTAWWQRAAVRRVAVLLVVGFVIWRVGFGSVLAGLAAVDVGSALLALTIGLVTTLACSWRWQLVARGVGLDLPVGAAVAGCYRSQFLNTVLPGGVLGDLHRGIRHGADVADVGRAVRAVAWERAVGQLVQVVITLVVVLVAGSRAVGPVLAIGAALVVMLVAVATVAALVSSRGADGRLARLVRVAAAELRLGVLTRRTLPGVVALSVLAVAGYAATFLVATRATGLTTGWTTVLPLAFVVLLAMAVPVNVAGWGPREGAAAAAFAAAGLGAAQGVSASVAYGLLVFVAALPGAGVLLIERLRAARGGVRG